jgi:hypothetical protein
LAITGYTFDRAKVTSQSDASLYGLLFNNKNRILPNRGNNLNVTTIGLTCQVNTGQALIYGRLIEITSTENIAVPANTTGYICITIDLSQKNTSTGTPGQSDYSFVLGQLKTEFVTTLVQQDLFNGGSIYNFNLGKVSSTSSEVSYNKNFHAYAVQTSGWINLTLLSPFKLVASYPYNNTPKFTCVENLVTVQGTVYVHQTYLNAGNDKAMFKIPFDYAPRTHVFGTAYAIYSDLTKPQQTHFIHIYPNDDTNNSNTGVCYLRPSIPITESAEHPSYYISFYLTYSLSTIGY